LPTNSELPCRFELYSSEVLIEGHLELNGKSLPYEGACQNDEIVGNREVKSGVPTKGGMATGAHAWI